MVIIKSDLLKVVFIWRDLCQCYIVLEEIVNLYSEEGLKLIIYLCQLVVTHFTLENCFPKSSLYFFAGSLDIF